MSERWSRLPRSTTWDQRYCCGGSAVRHDGVACGSGQCLLDPVVSEYSISLASCRLPSPLQRPWLLFWPNAPALTKFMVLFLIDLSTRCVAIAGIAIKADGIRMDQVNRNFRDAGNGFLMGKRYLIHDRDLLFTAEFLGMLADCGVQSVKLPPRSPKLNAHAERFVRTIKKSCLTG